MIIAYVAIGIAVGVLTCVIAFTVWVRKTWWRG